MRLDFVDQEQPSSSREVRDIPEHFRRLFHKKILKKVSKLTSFLSSCLGLIQDKDVVLEIQVPIEETPEELQPS